MPTNKPGYMKEYFAKNPDKKSKSKTKYISKPIQCECGVMTSTKNKSAHMKTKKHFFIMQIINNIKQPN